MLNPGNPERALTIVTTFINQFGPERGVNNYTLRGPINQPTTFHTFACLFPELVGPRDTYMILGTREIPAPEMYCKILGLAIPDRLQDLQRLDDRPLRQTIERIMVYASLPSIVLAFGETLPGNSEVVNLSAIQGISPQTALRELQDRTRDRQASRN